MDFILDNLNILIPPIVSLLGALFTLWFMIRQNNKQIKMNNEHHDEQMRLRIEELEISYQQKNKEMMSQIGLSFLPTALKTIQTAFTHIMSINTLLNNAASISRSKASLDINEESKKLHQILIDIRKWYDSNCIYAQ